MAADPVVLAALVKALEADPESAPIRLHLAALLIESGGEASAMSPRIWRRISRSRRPES